MEGKYFVCLFWLTCTKLKEALVHYTKKFYVKGFYVMGKALSGELTCTQTGLVSS